MEEYTIQYSDTRKLRIYRWAVLFWGLSYFFVFLMDYRSGTTDWFSYMMLVLSLIIMPISLFWF